ASEYSELEPVVARIRDLLASRSEADDLKSMLNDAATDKDMRDLAEAELPDINERIEALEQDIQVLLLPK
ncbi:PCRF domain-containing protein, partial [Stenotrophomonas maltophilia]|uniref:PCRF domain-containing protein n=2 Tax=Pseudomonadota TaxID=1224 RepID=UPI0013DD7D3A